MVLSYATIVPVNMFERACALFFMIIGGAIYAYMIDAICGLLSMADPATHVPVGHVGPAQRVRRTRTGYHTGLLGDSALRILSAAAAASPGAGKQEGQGIELALFQSPSSRLNPGSVVASIGLFRRFFRSSVLHLLPIAPVAGSTGVFPAGWRSPNARAGARARAMPHPARNVPAEPARASPTRRFDGCGCS